jgi:uncharacterized membrane protein HdeD (DUF308 family)
MSVAAMSVAVTLAGSVLLLVGAGRVSRAREATRDRWHRWLTLGGLALLFIGLWIRIASISPDVGVCAASSSVVSAANAPTHCFHGAPWPPRGSSR